MEKEQLDTMSDEQKALVAVAYLLGKPELRPVETQALYKKIDAYDASATSINEQIKGAQRFIQESKTKINQLIGSMSAVSEIIASMLPKDKIDQWCLDFKMPNGMNNPSELAVPEAKPDIDVAGATAKKMPPVDVASLSKGK